MDVENILKLINAVSESELTEFNYDEGELHLKLSKKQKQVVVQASPAPVVTENAAAMMFPQMAAPQMQPVATSVGNVAEQAEEQSAPSYTGTEVKSPLVGTFYSAPSPEDAPFVKVGDRVKKGQTLGIVEAMKLMNEIESECDGVVQAILVENEEIVEYGQPLFVIGE